MTVDQLDVVDFVGINPKTDEVLLAICDHLEWTPPDFEMEHIYLLQEKINAYLGSIENGEIFERYPKARGKKFVIRVMLTFPMSDEGTRFSEWATSFIRDAGHRIEFEHVPLT
jgi:hypothetical protein